jgi:anhydro-N-acetylmuramic acid kinase
MSGTSMDGVDVALIETDGERVGRLGPQSFLPYGAEDRALLRAALEEAKAINARTERSGVLAQAEALVTQRHAEAVELFFQAHGAQPVDVVGFHGQTVQHRPQERLTVQIGDGAALARRIGLPVVYDLRAADVAAGGQGAPLVPVFHAALARSAGLAETLAILNLGGVGNITWIAPGADPIACDTGPGNALMDDLMLERTGVPLDRDGACAAQGVVDEKALARLMAHPFFGSPPPKSLDRNAFSKEPVAQLATPDAAATLAAFTAESVAAALRLLPSAPTRLIVCGGGARNPTLLRMLSARAGVRIETAEDHGWSSDAMEAQAFAFLAARSQRGLPLTFPTTTGVSAPLTGGVCALP